MTTDIINAELGKMAAVASPDETRNKRKAEYFLAMVEEFSIATADDYERATAELRALKTAADAMEADRVSFTGPLNKVLKMLNDRFQPSIKLLELAEKTIKGKISAYLVEQQRKADEERRRAEAVAAAERKRLADEADRVRKEAEAVAEAARKAEEARAAAARAELERKAAAEQAAARGKKAKELAEQRAKEEREAEERRAAHAAQLLADAEEEAARRVAALETTAAVTIAQPSTVVVHKGRGISTPKKLVGVVTDKLALMKFIVEQRPDLAVLFDVNPTALNAQVKLMGLGTSVPGIRVDEQTSISVR